MGACGKRVRRLKQDESYDNGSRLVRVVGRREVSACEHGRINRPEKPGEAPEALEDRVHGPKKRSKMYGPEASGISIGAIFLAHDKEEMPIVWPEHADLCRTPTACLSYSVTVADWEHQN